MDTFPFSFVSLGFLLPYERSTACCFRSVGWYTYILYHTVLYHTLLTVCSDREHRPRFDPLFQQGNESYLRVPRLYIPLESLCAAAGSGVGCALERKQFCPWRLLGSRSTNTGVVFGSDVYLMELGYDPGFLKEESKNTQ